MKESRIENVEIMNENWLEVDGREIKEKINLVICSHFLWQMKDLEKHLKQFEPDADYFAYLILRQWGRQINVRFMNYSVERNFEQEMRYIASFMGKYVVENSIRTLYPQK